MNEQQKTIKDLPACPVETTLTLIGDKWKVLILRDLMPGTKRFGELKKSIGSVSQKVLTAQLRDMEQSGLVNRKVYAEVPPRVEYSLTELGQSLKPILDAMQHLSLIHIYLVHDSEQVGLFIFSQVGQLHRWAHGNLEHFLVFENRVIYQFQNFRDKVGKADISSHLCLTITAFFTDNTCRFLSA